MSPAAVRALGVAVFAVLALLPTLPLRMAAPANHGAHPLTSGFGRGRLDLQGIVSEGIGTISLPREPQTLTLRISGAGATRISAEGVDRTILAGETPTSVKLDLQGGGEVRVESASRIRLHEMVIERKARSGREIALILVAGLFATLLASRGLKALVPSVLVLAVAFLLITANSLSGTFARIALVQLAPFAASILLFTPMILAVRTASFAGLRPVTRLTSVAFFAALAL